MLHGFTRHKIHMSLSFSRSRLFVSASRMSEGLVLCCETCTAASKRAMKLSFIHALAAMGVFLCLAGVALGASSTADAFANVGEGGGLKWCGPWTIAWDEATCCVWGNDFMFFPKINGCVGSGSRAETADAAKCC